MGGDMGFYATWSGPLLGPLATALIELKSNWRAQDTFHGKICLRHIKINA